MTAKIIQLRDFRRKEEKPPAGLSLDTPPEVLLTIYESSLGFLSPPFVAPEKDPA